MITRVYRNKYNIYFSNNYAEQTKTLPFLTSGQRKTAFGRDSESGCILCFAKTSFCLPTQAYATKEIVAKGKNHKSQKKAHAHHLRSFEELLAWLATGDNLVEQE